MTVALGGVQSYTGSAATLLLLAVRASTARRLLKPSAGLERSTSRKSTRSSMPTWPVPGSSSRLEFGISSSSLRPSVPEGIRRSSVPTMSCTGVGVLRILASTRRVPRKIH
eukprot:scaffold1397_cov254-Pinguiococcus_pyrenoidosus.AAC.43